MSDSSQDPRRVVWTSMATSTILLLLVLVTSGGSAVSAEGPQQMLIPSRLMVRYAPPVSTAVSKNHKTNIEFHARLNLSGLLSPNTVGLHADDPDYVPLWLRCPGRLTAVPEPRRLLEIVNDTVDVLPIDFMEGISTVLVLCGKQLGHVRLVLYWELGNASMCTELPGNDEGEDDGGSHVESMVAMPVTAANTLGQGMDMMAATTTTSSTVTSTIGSQTSSSRRPPLPVRLNKTFVVVRGSDRRRRRRRSFASNDEHKCQVNASCHQHGSSNKIVIDNGYYVHVLQEENVLHDAMMYVTVVVAALNMFLIGFRVKLDEVKAILKRPIGPSVGFVCQALLMPLISYALAVVMFRDEKNAQLGLLALSTSPTAVLSISWTLILNGDISLGVTMTALTILCAFFVMPLWFTVLDEQVLPNVTKSVPRAHLLTSLATLVVPLCITAILIHIRPSVATVVAKIDRPAAAALMFALSSMAIVTSWSIASQLNWSLVGAAAILTCIGYISGWTMASLCRMDRGSVTAVAIVTAFQNADIAYAFVQRTLLKPDSDLSSVQPYVHMVATNVLVLLANCFLVAVHERRTHGKHTVDLPQSSVRGGDQVTAEPLIIRAVFTNDTQHGANGEQQMMTSTFLSTSTSTSTSYIPNEPLTSDIENEADNRAAGSNGISKKRANNDYDNTRRHGQIMEGNCKTFNTFGK